MSAPEPSSTGTVNPAEKSEVGGTSFLDLPFELPEMIYDLCAPKRCHITNYHDIIFRYKPVITGIRLLRCSRQIYNEVSQRLAIWGSTWVQDEVPPPTPAENSCGLDCSLAMSGLHDLALAKIKALHFRLRILTGTDAVLSLRGLEALLKLKSLYQIIVVLELNTSHDIPVVKGMSDLENLPLFTGLVIRILSHIPISVRHLDWQINYRSNQPRSVYCDFLRQLAAKYKSLRGSAYTSEQDIRVWRDLGKSSQF